MLDTDRFDDHAPSETLRPLVVLALEDSELYARLAYELTAFGFNVAVPVDEGRPPVVDGSAPDVIIVMLSARTGSGREWAQIFRDDGRFRGVPMVALAANVDRATRDLARRLGCAAVCLTTCSGDVLANGVRAVLGRSRVVEGLSNHCHA